MAEEVAVVEAVAIAIAGGGEDDDEGAEEERRWLRSGGRLAMRSPKLLCV